jgi:transposase-like protein
MADDVRMALDDLLRKAHGDGDIDFLKEGLRVMAQALMELEVTHHLGAERYERSPERTGQRNGYRERPWDTRVGTVELRVPRVRDGSFFPALLEPRRRAEKALLAVVQEAYVQGVSTRRVDALVKALGMEGISKSQVSRLCQGRDAEVARFRTRPLLGLFPYVWLDATYLKVRQQGRIVSMAVVLATGVTIAGERQVPGLEAGPRSDGASWQQFLRGLVARGLTGVDAQRPGVISDAHGGLVGAIAAVLQGASWQRCRVHRLRDIHDLTQAHPADARVQGWAEAMHALFVRATAAGPPPADRAAQQRACEQEALALGRPYLEDAAAPQRGLCRRIARHLGELFVFVADPAVPATNNAAERSRRHLVTSRKISGGTRSAEGTATKMTLATLFGTWRARGLDPLTECRRLLSAPQV